MIRYNLIALSITLAMVSSEIKPMDDRNEVAMGQVVFKKNTSDRHNKALYRAKMILSHFTAKPYDDYKEFYDNNKEQDSPSNSFCLKFQPYFEETSNERDNEYCG